MKTPLYEAVYLLEPSEAKRLKKPFEYELLHIAPEYEGRIEITVMRAPFKGRLRVRITGRGDREMAERVIALVEARLGI